MPTFEASGGILSTAGDLAALLGAVLGYRHTSLDGAIAMMATIRRPGPAADRRAALGWDVLQLEPGDELVFKDGATGGYRSFLGWDASTGTGVAVLSNTATRTGVADIGMHVLNPEIPLESSTSLSRPPRPVDARRAIRAEH